MENTAIAAQVKPDSTPPAAILPRKKQSVARALAIVDARLGDEFRHCIETMDYLEALHAEYLDEAMRIKAERDALRPSRLSAALREMREIMLRKHPDFEGAIALPRPMGE